MTAQDIMSRPVHTVTEDHTLADAAEKMLAQDIGCLPVVDAQGRMTGIVTESDFAAKDRGVPFSLYRYPQVFGQWMSGEHVERMYEAAREKTVREVMCHPVVAASESDSIDTVLRAMLRTGYHRLPVVRDGVPVGVVSRRDLLKLMLAERTSS